MTTIGIVCDNTCENFSPGDNTPDFLFGSAFGNLGGQPFRLTQNAFDFFLNINGTTLTVPLSDITLADPSLGFGPGTLQFKEILVNNPYGIAFEQEYLCPTPMPPGVPEPGVAALFLLGLAFIGFRRYKSPR